VNVEPKICEFCQRQFLRSADKHPFLRAKYCEECEAAFAHAKDEQLHNDEIKEVRYAIN